VLVLSNLEYLEFRMRGSQVYNFLMGHLNKKQTCPSPNCEHQVAKIEAPILANETRAGVTRPNERISHFVRQCSNKLGELIASTETLQKLVLTAYNYLAATISDSL
jgi:hypothetical protein